MIDYILIGFILLTGVLTLWKGLYEELYDLLFLLISGLLSLLFLKQVHNVLPIYISLPSVGNPVASAVLKDYLYLLLAFLLLLGLFRLLFGILGFFFKIKKKLPKENKMTRFIALLIGLLNGYLLVGLVVSTFGLPVLYEQFGVHSAYYSFTHEKDPIFSGLASRFDQIRLTKEALDKEGAEGIKEVIKLLESDVIPPAVLVDLTKEAVESYTDTSVDDFFTDEGLAVDDVLILLEEPEVQSEVNRFIEENELTTDDLEALLEAYGLSDEEMTAVLSAIE